jgi:hypothetical protein
MHGGNSVVSVFSVVSPSFFLSHENHSADLNVVAAGGIIAQIATAVGAQRIDGDLALAIARQLGADPVGHAPRINGVVGRWSAAHVGESSERS